MLARSISKNSFILGAFALITAATLALTNEGTRERIVEAQRQAAQQALLDIVPLERHSNDMLLDTLDVPQAALRQLGLKDSGKIHLARENNQTVALLIPTTAPDGYSGRIDLLVGVNRDGSLAGVRVLEHNETPGLGDKIELKKSPWVLSFNGKSLSNPTAEHWTVKKDGGAFDQFTGATITPRAVVQQVKRSLEFVRANPELFERQPQQSYQQDPS